MAGTGVLSFKESALYGNQVGDPVGRFFLNLEKNKTRTDINEAWSDLPLEYGEFIQNKRAPKRVLGTDYSCMAIQDKMARHPPMCIGILSELISQVMDVGFCQRRRASRGSQEAAWARQITMYLAHVLFQFSFSAIAGFFGRDEATVRHACQRVEAFRDCPEFDAKLSSLEGDVAVFFGL